MLDFLTNVRKVETLTAADIQLLVDNQVAENKKLDYKLKLPWDKEEDKEEFLKDVSSFYNTEGGVLIYGLQEVKLAGTNTGIPQLPTIAGLELKNTDKTKLAILSCIRTGTNPAMSTVYFSELLDLTGHPIFAIGIPKNNGLPVMVTKNDVNCFYRRNQSQKYVMDTHELYQAFLKHGSERREVERLVAERQELLYVDYFSPLKAAPQLNIYLLHTEYLQNVALDTFFDPDFLSFAQGHFGSKAYNVKQHYAYGFDGLHLMARQNSKQPGEYFEGTLLMRNGVIEGLITSIFSEWEANKGYSGNLYGEQLLDVLVQYIKGAFAYYERASISAGFYLSITLKMPGQVSLSGERRVAGSFKNKQLNFPLFLITGPSEVGNTLGLIMDILFQAVGEAGCPESLKQKAMEKFALLATPGSEVAKTTER